MKSSRDDLLLVFTLGPVRESRRRQLLPPRWGDVEQRLHQACLDEALVAGREAGCRLRVSSPDSLELPADVERAPQSGLGFGDRLRTAMTTALEEGGPVVLVGSDVPGMSAGHVSRTLELLQEDPDRVVLGPSPDGGFYLLAAARSLDEALRQVAWCCQGTLASLRRALQRAGRPVVLLAPLADLDRRADLERWLAVAGRAPSIVWHALRRLLGQLLAVLRRPGDGVGLLVPRRSRFCRPPLRAPPAFS